MAAESSAGESSAAESAPAIVVVQLDGLLDPPSADLVERSIDDASRSGAPLVVFQVSSPGSVGVDAGALVTAVEQSPVPVAVWVGPSGASARGVVAMLLEAAHVAAVAPGSHLGPALPVELDEPGRVTRSEAERRLAALATERGRDAEAVQTMAGERLEAGEARRLGIVDRVEPTVGGLIVSLDGQVVRVAGELVRLSTARVVGEGAGARRTPDPEVRFERLDLLGQLVHALTSPSMAYLLMVVGLSLIVFEFFTAGVGLAGLAGALALVGSIVGFGNLPVTWWGGGLVAFGMFGFAIEVQATGLGSWTFIGGAALTAGSLTLYGGSSRLDPPWWVLLLVVTGTVAFMLGAMTAAIRSRFSTPTVGREGMIGEEGAAEAAIDPDGMVRVRGALWRARAGRATPIAAGDRVRVTAVEGLVLEVEPLVDGAGPDIASG